MNYEQFRTLWHEALARAGLMSLAPFQPSETIDLAAFSRTYELNIILETARPKTWFFVSATLDWRWDALQAARSLTVEEDVLTELLGRSASDRDTVPPWLRIDLTLRATLPLDSRTPLPEPPRWRRWTAEVTARLESILPIESRMDDDDLMVLSSRSEPEARLRCDPDGRLFLSRVELSAWQGIDIPRQWDHPDRPPDPKPDAQLFDFAQRARRALQVWEVDDPPLDTDYICLVNRANYGEARISEIWPVALNEALPTIPIPLLADDPDVLLELPEVMAGIYTRAAYARRIDYNQPVPTAQSAFSHPRLAHRRQTWFDTALTLFEVW